MANIAVFGIYATAADAELAVTEMRTAGFRSADISLLLPMNEGTEDLTAKKPPGLPEGSTTSAASGAVLGGALGWLLGIGALAMPGLGAILAAGPIMVALTGLGIGGALGGVGGTLVGMGIPEYKAKRVAGLMKEGSILVSIHTDNQEWTDRAKEILEHTRACEVSSAGEAKPEPALAVS
jgi:hypothetical protein